MVCARVSVIVCVWICVLAWYAALESVFATSLDTADWADWAAPRIVIIEMYKL